MRKIPTLFVRDEATNRKYVTDEVVPESKWVIDGEGVATRKYDGTCVMFDGWRWWARREVKPPKTAPRDFVEVEHDPVTGKTVGWVPAHDSSFGKFVAEAVTVQSAPVGLVGAMPDSEDLAGTYELCGPKINGNPEDFPEHRLVAHASAEELPDAPRDFASLGAWLHAHDYEGIVWHHPDGRMAKIKKRDFPA